MDMQLWLERAIAKIATMPSGKEFEIRNLFYEVDWEALPKGDRIRFGKFFKNEVSDGRVTGIRYKEKNKNNHAKYIKE